MANEVNCKFANNGSSPFLTFTKYMLIPKKFTYKKVHKKRVAHGTVNYKSRIVFGQYAIKVLEFMRISANQLDFFRQEVSKFFRRKSKVWLRGWPSLPLTFKKEQSRMGKGVGVLSSWVFLSYPGQILFEFTASSVTDCFELLRKCKKIFAVKICLSSNL